MSSEKLDAHAKPPAAIHRIYKRYQKAKACDLQKDEDIIQADSTGSIISPRVRAAEHMTLPVELQQIFVDFLRSSSNDADSSRVDHDDLDLDITQSSPSQILEIPDLPGKPPHQTIQICRQLNLSLQVGLYIYPSLLPPPIQTSLLHRLLHRDLSLPSHKTNVHMHYDLPYPSSSTSTSFFSPSLTSSIFTPKDPTIHKPLTTSSFLTKKLRWMTLGGQYDWTNKVYPPGTPVPFPSDIKALIEDIFPMNAEAAIVNLYSPGHTLSCHRDVSEECNRPLVSISIGCDALFIVGLDAPSSVHGEADVDAAGPTGAGEGERAEAVQKQRVAVLRLRSGDAVLMSGESRYAWHGVPKVLEDTCPAWLQDWPHQDHAGRKVEEYEQWKGWMKGKRINLNVRQMFG